MDDDSNVSRRLHPDVYIQDNLGDEREEIASFTYSISSYGADFDVDGLVRRIESGSVYVPSFQRGFVWSVKQASRFVESLLLGLPVPGIFLSKEAETQKLLVIDGQQRLRSLQFFFRGVFADSGREFVLRGVQQRYEGLTYRTLLDEDRRRLHDSILHATIIKQDEPTEDNSSIYYIFERLNTGGTMLQPQEIRACVNHGEFNDLLRTLNQNADWRSVFGPVHRRMRDQELILRFLALFYEADRYKKPMKGFLNSFMSRNNHLEKYPADQLKRVFEETIGIVRQSLGQKAFKPRRVLNAAVFDAVMVGLANRLSYGPIHDLEAVQDRYDELFEDIDFLKNVETGTADEESVKGRLALARAAFSGVR